MRSKFVQQLKTLHGIPTLYLEGFLPAGQDR
jgi:hypothetical protein